MQLTLAAKAFMGSSIVTAIGQAIPPGDLGGMATQIERSGFIGVLIIGIGVLWRALAKKEDQLAAMLKAVTEALVTVTESNRELRLAVTDGQGKLLDEVRKKNDR